MDVPAAPRSRRSMIAATASGGSLPRPTSTSVPTTARTILRRKRSAVISKAITPLSQGIQRALRTSQMLVLTSVCSLENDVKSRIPTISDAAWFMASKSSLGGAAQVNARVNGERRVDA